MNFLQLCQRLCDETSIPRAGLTTVSGQTGELLRAVNWINAAWLDIQAAHQDWQWLRESCSFTTVAGQATYSPATDIGLTDFGAWARDTFRIYDTAAGYGSETHLDYQKYERWRDCYQFGSQRTTYARPCEITIAPDKSLGLGPVPTAGYTVVGDYYRAPSEMSVDADTPELPAQFHLAIVYRAMMSYGIYNAANEVYQRGELEFMKMMRRITADRLPEITLPGALA